MNFNESGEPNEDKNDGIESNQQAFRDAVEVQILSMVADGKLTEEEAEEKRKAADLITDGIPDDVAHAAKTFVMAGVSSESETVAHFNAERASAEDDDHTIESSPEKALYESFIAKDEQANALFDAFTVKLEEAGALEDESTKELVDQYESLKKSAKEDLDAWFEAAEVTQKTYEEELASYKN